jgi:two-component system cell cycle sensor histidine kinase/response regulator CckA
MNNSPRAPRVLVVDDEESVRAFGERALASAGYDVVSAADGHAALRLIEHQGPFDLFLIDLMMPGMNGDELVRRLRAMEPDAKVLYFTGHADRLFTGKPILWEHEAFVEKPITTKALREAVSMLLFGHTEGRP